MKTLISQQIQDLQAKIAEAAEQIASLEAKFHAMDDELAGLLHQQPRYQLLDEIGSRLEKLHSLGATDLFKDVTGHDPEKQQQRMRGVVDAFRQKISAVEQSRGALQADIKDKQSSLRRLEEQLAERQQKAERLKNDPQHDMPYRVLPWSHHADDERLFRRLLVTTVLLTVAFGAAVPFFKQPVEEEKGIVVPERIARIIKNKQEAKLEKKLLEEAALKQAETTGEKTGKKPAEAVQAEKAPEKVAEKAPEKVAEKTAERGAEKTAERGVEKGTERGIEKGVEKAPSGGATKPAVAQDAQAARKAVESKGVLAFKNDLEGLLKDAPSAKMGADARISINANRATGDILQRSIIVSQSTGGSGGINTSAISRQSEGGGSQRITNVEIKFTHVESAASAQTGGAEQPSGKGDRQLNKGPASRTDEEIQLVFDQYKSALYRIYNRELRNNPSLRGKMVLRIVIEPDGHVSSCTVKSTDLTSATLSADIVDRILKFDFGLKEGVPAITILYPIDFLPAN